MDHIAQMNTEEELLNRLNILRTEKQRIIEEEQALLEAQAKSEPNANENSEQSELSKHNGEDRKEETAQKNKQKSSQSNSTGTMVDGDPNMLVKINADAISRFVDNAVIKAKEKSEADKSKVDQKTNDAITVQSEPTATTEQSVSSLVKRPSREIQLATNEIIKDTLKHSLAAGAKPGHPEAMNEWLKNTQLSVEQKVAKGLPVSLAEIQKSMKESGWNMGKGVASTANIKYQPARLNIDHRKLTVLRIDNPGEDNQRVTPVFRKNGVVAQLSQKGKELTRELSQSDTLELKATRRWSRLSEDAFRQPNEDKYNTPGLGVPFLEGPKK